MVTKGLANLDVPRMLAAVNSIFERGEFPAQWKTNRLTIIRKPGKDPTRPEAYCPISIVDAGSKILEYRLQDRLLRHVGLDGFSVNQYGFKKGRSTI